jgi:hypothetical protein
VGDENAGAHDAEECGKCFQHGNDPVTQRPDLTARGDTQSKGFLGNPNFQSGVMISSNTLKGLISETGRYPCYGGAPIGRLLGKGICPAIGSSLVRAEACKSGNRLRIILEARVKAAAASSSGVGC